MITSSVDQEQDPPTQNPVLERPTVKTDIKAKEIHPEDLHSKRPVTGIQTVDEEVTVNFDADIADLQRQVYELHNNLATNYPRSSSVPYNVWESKNRNTLLMWLKILTRRWETRFDASGVPSYDPSSTVLDDMVKVHKLDNKAAERMLERFREVSARRVRLHSSLGTALDQEEFDASMGWLKADEISDYTRSQSERESRQQSDNRMPFLTGSGAQHRTVVKESPAPAKMQIRHYSSKPNNREVTQENMENQSKPTTTPPQPTALPHLTSSGSAHMVSVSAKPETFRTAVAVGVVHFSNPTPLSLIRSNSLKKGDVLSVARIAGNGREAMSHAHPTVSSHRALTCRRRSPAHRRLWR
jgi:hypothetical protein